MNINIGVHSPGATAVFKDPNLHANSFLKNPTSKCVFKARAI
jgi:hypothetical protein